MSSSFDRWAIQTEEFKVGDVITEWMPGVDAKVTRVVKHLGQVRVHVDARPSVRSYMSGRTVSVLREKGSS